MSVEVGLPSFPACLKELSVVNVSTIAAVII